MGVRHVAVPPITEPVPIQEVFVTGVDWQICQDFVRIIYWTEQMTPFGAERQIVAKIIMPLRVWLALPFRRPEPANVG